MPSMIDHIVIVDKDLDMLVSQAETAGFTVVPGGEHAGGMTHNALIAFQDGSYIELIAFLEPEKRTSHRWWPRLWKGGGLVDFALLCSDLEKEVDDIRERGLRIPAPVENGRLRPDGERLDWRQSFPQAIVGETGMPFLIEDVTPRSLRVPHGDDATTHPNGVVGIAGITLLVEEFDDAASSIEAITGNKLTELEQSLPGMSRAATARMGSELGQWITIATAEQSNAEDFGDEALPARYVEKYGFGPFSAVLTSGAPADSLGPEAGAEIDVSLLAASRLRLA